MKTALERIFEKHDKEFDKMNFLRWLSDNRKELLEAGKEQIMEGWNIGLRQGAFEDLGFNTAEQYYQQTYNQEQENLIQ